MASASSSGSGSGSAGYGLGHGGSLMGGHGHGHSGSGVAQSLSTAGSIGLSFMGSMLSQSAAKLVRFSTAGSTSHDNLVSAAASESVVTPTFRQRRFSVTNSSSSSSGSSSGSNATRSSSAGDVIIRPSLLTECCQLISLLAKSSEINRTKFAATNLVDMLTLVLTHDPSLLTAGSGSSSSSRDTTRSMNFVRSALDSIMTSSSSIAALSSYSTENS